MAESAFPMRSTVEQPEGEAACVGFEEADAVFEALASDTARAIVSSLSEEPATPSELADRVDTSVQNATYHLDRLADAGLVGVVDTWYSSKGVEMDVYATARDPLVVCVGDEHSEQAVARAVEKGAGADRGVARPR